MLIILIILLLLFAFGGYRMGPGLGYYGGGGISLRRLSRAIHSSASASDSNPSIVWRVPSLPTMLMLKPEPSPLGTTEYVVMFPI